MRNLQSFLTKRSFRNTVTLLLMACMMLGLLPMAQAEPVSAFQAEVISAAGRGGETVSVAVYMQPGIALMEDDSFWKYTLQVNYDPNVLTIAGDIANDAEAATFDTSESVTGSVYVKADTFPNLFIDERKQVFTMKFVINPAAPPGDTDIVIAGGSYSIDDPVEITNLISGKVTVLNDAPTASNASIGGTLNVGETLTANYTYADTESNSEADVSIYQWYQASDSAGSDKTPIPAATGKTFELGNDQLGKYILFEVTPVASGGTTSGSPVFSTVAGPVTATGAAASVSIGTADNQPGTVVKVPVTLSTASSGVGSFGMRVAFDAEALEIVSIAGPQAAVFDSVYSNTDGYLKTAWVDSSGGDYLIAGGQSLFTVTFKIKATASYGVKALTIADEADLQQFTLTDALGVEMTKTLRAGSVTVSQEEESRGSAQGPTKEIIQVDVKAPGSKDTAPVSKAEIERTTKSDGTKSDKVLLTTEQAKQSVVAIREAGLKTANIMIPDAKDEVSEVNVTVPKAASGLFAGANIDIGIVTDNVKVSIPNDSLQDFNDDLYFRFVPIKRNEEKQEIKTRADQDQIVLTVVGDHGVTIVGRPMTIETNLQNRKVNLVMPLKDVQLSREELANLAVYVEHSDGTKELLYGQLVEYGASEGDWGLQFSVSKFSTFSIVHLDLKVESHTPYMEGYTNGTFGPDKMITRAEMATILSRVIVKDANAKDINYRDVPADYWAAVGITEVTVMELMNGYPDGTFAPDKPITRAEMASLAAAQITGGTTGKGFTDTANHWANEAIAKVQGAGIMQGYEDGSFLPEQYISRAEAVTMINRMLGRKSGGELEVSPWSDVPKTHWAFADILEASVAHRFTKDAADTESWVEQP
ncbi:S-layer homology domain-containing protein [Paenibacillus oryzisoli]|uniref:S-layer homology domain-containing protein n=1 Tax=Paenibacillus oryzisoli TaxID=1850517 RepID=UPI003D2CB7A0